MSDEVKVVQTDEKDAEDNKLMGIIAYIIFFVPLLAAKESRFAMYHANQGLVLLILTIIISIAGNVIPILGTFFISPLGSLLCFILLILGIVNAAQGKMAPLPLIGKFEILQQK